MEVPGPSLRQGQSWADAERREMEKAPRREPDEQCGKERCWKGQAALGQWKGGGGAAAILAKLAELDIKT